jgi:signal transduction histidine kinase
VFPPANTSARSATAPPPSGDGAGTEQGRSGDGAGTERGRSQFSFLQFFRRTILRRPPGRHNFASVASLISPRLPRFLPRRGAAAISHLATPLAVVALLAITAKLTLDARSAERSHRAAAERALRDYAGFAAWEFERHLSGHMRSHLMMTLAPIRESRRRSEKTLAAPHILTDHAGQCKCGFKDDIVFAFRIQLNGGKLVLDRPVPAATQQALVRHLQAGVGRIAARGKVPTSEPEMHEWLRRTATIAFDTLAGQPVVLAYGFLMDNNSRARAIYGVASNLSHLREDVERVIAEEALLPPSLVNGRPNDAVLAIRVLHPVIGMILETAPAPADVPMYTDTLEAGLGETITTVALRPELANSLLIGGIPPSRLPLQLTLLAVATALALVALLQVRRNRELGRLREQFVANVSHELRTPLTQISMLSETLMLGRERSEDERRDFASVVYREAGRLTSLVESVLRFSRGQASPTTVSLQPREVAREVGESTQAFMPMARAADVTIDTRVPAGLSARLDPAAFRQVMLNLFDNAVKFGPRSQTIVVDAVPQNGVVAISVTDQGRGIPERDRRRVFNAYTRIETNGQPAVAGAGIGLSVVHDLVRAHGGRVWIETPSSGGGTRVTFTLLRDS